MFQPIVESAEPANIFSIEALTRGPEGTQFEDAAVFFDYLRRTHQEVRGDRRCFVAAVRAAASFDPSREPRISINIHPSTLEQDRGFARFAEDTLAAAGLDPRRLIIEILEEPRYWNTRALRATLAELRALGVTIALDDVGMGGCNYAAIIDVAPDLLKLDRYLVQHCSTDPRRGAIVESLQGLASNLGVSVVAEGIESAEDFAFVRAAGITYSQGYYFSRPRTFAELTGRRNEIECKEPGCPERRFFSSMIPTPF